MGRLSSLSLLDHTTSIQVNAALETEPSQACPNNDLTITCSGIKSLPQPFPLASRMEGKQTRIAGKSVLNSSFSPSPPLILGRRFLGQKLGKGCPEHAGGADFLCLVVCLVVLLFPPGPCCSQHCSAENLSPSHLVSSLRYLPLPSSAESCLCWSWLTAGTWSHCATIPSSAGTENYRGG